MHTVSILGTLLMIGGIVAFAIGFRKYFQDFIAYVILGLPYLVYLLLALRCSDVKGYISNLKKFIEYKKTYDAMIKGTGYFVFWIECYHYPTIAEQVVENQSMHLRTSKRIVSHTAT